jgi:hypothetical protein
MSELEDAIIGCPQCNFSNTVTPPTAKYKEVVYQPCEDNEGEADHNLKRQTRCENCHNEFDFYWCTGHSEVLGASPRRKFDHDLKWPQT